MWRSYVCYISIIWLYVRYVRTEDGPMTMYDSIGRAIIIIHYINQIKCMLLWLPIILRFMRVGMCNRFKFKQESFSVPLSC